MITIRVSFEDGDSFDTRFNGTKDEAIAYYVGKTFNTGTVRDHLVKCTGIDVLD